MTKLYHYGTSFLSLFSLDRQKFCLTLCAPAIPPCKDPPFPGPGQYNLVDYGGSLKQNCSSAVFVSNTERWMGGRSQEGFPGPGKNKNYSEVLLSARDVRPTDVTKQRYCPFNRKETKHRNWRAHLQRHVDTWRHTPFLKGTLLSSTCHIGSFGYCDRRFMTTTKQLNPF